MNVRWTRTVQIANGKYMEAIGWAKETASFVEKKWHTPQVSCWIDTFGQVNTIRWCIDFPDLQSIEKIQLQMMQDTSYWQLVEKAMKGGLFIDGTTCDTICRQL